MIEPDSGGKINKTSHKYTLDYQESILHHPEKVNNRMSQESFENLSIIDIYP